MDRLSHEVVTLERIYDLSLHLQPLANQTLVSTHSSSMAEEHPNTPKNTYIVALVYLIAFCGQPSDKQLIIPISPVNHRNHVLLETLPIHMSRINHGATTQYETITVKLDDVSEGIQTTLEYTVLDTVGDPSKIVKIGVKTILQLLICHIRVTFKRTKFHICPLISPS